MRSSEPLRTSRRLLPATVPFTNILPESAIDPMSVFIQWPFEQPRLFAAFCMFVAVAMFSPTHGQVKSQNAASDTQARRRQPEMVALFDLADRDPTAAFAEISRTYTGEAVERAEALLAAYLLEKDFTTVAKTFRLVTKPLARQSAMIEIVPRVFERDPAGTLATIRENLSGNDQSYALWRVVIAQLERNEWRDAIQTQLSMRGDLRNQAILNVALKVATIDLDAALHWLGQLASDEQKRAHLHIREALSEAEDDAGLALLLTFTPIADEVRPGGYISWGRENMIVRIACLRRQRGDLAGIANLRVSLSASERELVDAVVISGDKTISPEIRIARVSQLKSGSARSDGINRVIALEWKNDPERTKRLVLSLPDATFGHAFVAMSHQWDDKTALYEWIWSLPTGLKHEKAISAFVMSLRYSRRPSEKALAREVATWSATSEMRERLERQLRH